jgi:hypothetical protein
MTDQEMEWQIDREKERGSKINNPCCIFDRKRFSFEQNAKVGHLLLVCQHKNTGWALAVAELTGSALFL